MKLHAVRHARLFVKKKFTRKWVYFFFSSPPKKKVMEADLPGQVDVDPTLNQEDQDTTMEETQEQPTESQEPASEAQEQTTESQTESTANQEEPASTNEQQESTLQEPEPMEEEKPEEAQAEQVQTESKEEEPVQMEVIDEEPVKKDSPPPKEEKVDEADPSSNSPLLSAPASWQIPVAALRPHTNKASLRKEKLESRIKENQYDIEAWTTLINDAQQTGDLDVIRDIYERFLKVFPTSVSFFFRVFRDFFCFVSDLCVIAEILALVS